MDEKKFIQFKKEEFKVKEFIKNSVRKGHISSVRIEYTPVGEKIIIATPRPGLIIGSRGERVLTLTETLKKKFKLENPHIDIQEIKKPELDAQIMAENISNGIEALGPLRFKVIAYRTLQKIIEAGALGVEIRLSGKLPSDRSRSWRFAYGYLKKTGDTAKIVDYAKTTAETKTGTIGVKVRILPPNVKIHDQIKVNEELINKIRMNASELEVKQAEESKKKEKKTVKKKSK